MKAFILSLFCLGGFSQSTGRLKYFGMKKLYRYIFLYLLSVFGYFFILFADETRSKVREDVILLLLDISLPLTLR